MRTVVLAESTTLKTLLALAKENNIILKTPDGEEFILAEIDDLDKEIELVRKNEELMNLLDHRAKETRTFTLKQVKEQLDLN